MSRDNEILPSKYWAKIIINLLTVYQLIIIQKWGQNKDIFR